MATKKVTRSKSGTAHKSPKSTAPKIIIHASGKKIIIPNDAKAEGKINDFVVDKMRIGSFQLLTSPDDSGKVVRLADIGSFTGEHLYVKERNKAQ